eukprot:766230-Hanusia_phi.AAC.3
MTELTKVAIVTMQVYLEKNVALITNFDVMLQTLASLEIHASIPYLQQSDETVSSPSCSPKLKPLIPAKLSAPAHSPSSSLLRQPFAEMVHQLVVVYPELLQADDVAGTRVRRCEGFGARD